METQQEINEFIKEGHRHYLSEINIDCAIFGYHNRQLKVLLVKWRGIEGSSLPGGFVKKNEPLTAAAHRILKEKTSLDKVYLQQFYTFGDSSYRIAPPRHPILPKNSWLQQRKITIGYYALVDYSKVTVVTDFLTTDFFWEDVNNVPSLLFDHDDLVTGALRYMRLNLYHQPIGYNLLEKKFTLPEIISLYETILGKKLDRRNFSKKLMSLGLLKDTHEVRRIGQHRSPKLYSFDKKKYDQALRDGVIITL
jgi:8-oxo-dGTP diphosphatase